MSTDIYWKESNITSVLENRVHNSHQKYTDPPKVLEPVQKGFNWI